jgi:hypothetical protein
MNTFIKAPERFVRTTRHDKRPTIFLAGGITGCRNWQQDVENKLSDNLDAVIFNPRQADFDVRDPKGSEKQIEWEHYHLEIAEYVLFWFPAEGQCMITLFELGKCLAGGKKVILGCHPDYVRYIDVVVQSRLMQPDIMIAEDLDELVAFIEYAAYR